MILSREKNNNKAPETRHKRKKRRSQLIRRTFVTLTIALTAITAGLIHLTETQNETVEVYAATNRLASIQSDSSEVKTTGAEESQIPETEEYSTEAAPEPDSPTTQENLTAASILQLTATATTLDTVEAILQNPELPTGCEITSLTILLRSWGFGVTKTEIADEYIDYGSNLALSYSGDPYSETGAGIFTTGLVNAANDYLITVGSNLTAYNLNGSDLEELFALVENGYPIVLWSTMYCQEPMMTDFTYSDTYQTYYWYENEHCIVLYGYDLEAGTVMISDPLEGYVTRDLEEFEVIYNEIGQYAMTIGEASIGEVSIGDVLLYR